MDLLILEYEPTILLQSGLGSSVGVATDYRWMVWDRIQVETRYSVHPDCPWGPPSLLYTVYWAFPG